MVNFGETNSANVEMQLVELQEALRVFGWYVRQSIVRRSILVDCSIMEKIPFLIILFELFPDFRQNFLRQIDFHLILNAVLNFSSPTFGPKIFKRNVRGFEIWGVFGDFEKLTNGFLILLSRLCSHNRGDVEFFSLLNR